MLLLFSVSGVPIESAASEDPATSKAAVRRRFAVYMLISFATKMLYNILLVEKLHLEEKMAYAIVLVVASIQNFFILMCWVYKTSDSSRLKQFIKFVSSVAVFYFAEWVTFSAIIELVEMRHKLAVVTTMAASVVMKYLAYKTIVFRKKHPDKTELAVLEMPPETIDEDAPSEESVNR